MKSMRTLVLLLPAVLAQSVEAKNNDVVKFKKLLFCGVEAQDHTSLVKSQKDPKNTIEIDGSKLTAKSYDEIVTQFGNAGVSFADIKAAEDEIAEIRKGEAEAIQAKGAENGRKMEQAMADPAAAAGDKMSPEAREALKKYNAGGGMAGMPGLPPGMKLPPGVKMPNVAGMPGGMGSAQEQMGKFGKDMANRSLAQDKSSSNVSPQTAKVMYYCQKSGDNTNKGDEQFHRILDKVGADGFLRVTLDYLGVSKQTLSDHVGSVTTTSTKIPKIEYRFAYYDKDGKEVAGGPSLHFARNVDFKDNTTEGWRDGYVATISPVVTKAVEGLYK